MAHEDILKTLRLIKLHPTPTRFFYLDGDELNFIMDGKMLKLLPPEYAKLQKFHEFYLSVDPEKKTAEYYAFNVTNFITCEEAEAQDGNIPWEAIEHSIMSFLTTTIHLLTNSIQGNESKVSEDKYGSKTAGSTTSQTPYYGSSYSSPHSTYYDQSDWKKRDAIKDKFTGYLSVGKTGMAIDYISDEIISLCEAQSFDTLNSLLWSFQMSVWESFNVPAMLAVLNATRGADHLLKDRGVFFGKVKERANKIRSAKLNEWLMALEPGKEYAGVKRYEKKPKENVNAKDQTSTATN